MNQNLIFTNDIAAALHKCLSGRKFNKLFVITDHNTERLVLPRLDHCAWLKNATNISIPAGDASKNLDSLAYVWQKLGEGGGTRHSIVVNLGGGVVTDLGGFAAATFKRGIPFINVPTTLLSAVDAAVGGKTGINFGGLKNEIGAFCEATDVIISTVLFSTLPQEELNSGFAEMIKHALLKGEYAYSKLLNFNINEHRDDHDALLALLKESVEVKAEIVAQDPHEKGIRRALNLGHTVGHAFESLALSRQKPIPHGYAVAWGMVVEIILSNFQKKFSGEEVSRFGKFIRDIYGAFHITCNDYDQLLAFMQHDKKSHAGEINCTLLSAPGEIHIDQTISPADMQSALDIYRDIMGI